MYGMMSCWEACASLLHVVGAGCGGVVVIIKLQELFKYQ